MADLAQTPNVAVAAAAFLNDRAVWQAASAVIALIALVLSQLPPLHILFRRSRIELTPFKRMNLWHRLGNPNCSLLLVIHNVGGRPVHLDGMELEFQKDGQIAFVLPAQSYWPSEVQNPTEVPFTRIHLKAGDTWRNVIHFYRELGRSDENRARDLSNGLRAEVARLLIAQGPQANNAPPVTVGDDVLQPIISFFNEQFAYDVGEYRVIVNLSGSPAAVLKPASFRITLFESDVDLLRRQTQRYRTGDGVLWDSRPQDWIVTLPVQST